jgi:uncharacterized membrane protein
MLKSLVQEMVVRVVPEHPAQKKEMKLVATIRVLVGVVKNIRSAMVLSTLNERSESNGSASLIMIGFILNIPFTVIGLLVALISIPTKISFRKNPYAFIVKVRKFWWAVGYMKNIRAGTIGNVVILGPNLADNDLEHELVHVEQHDRLPVIFPVLYYIELVRKGYRSNKYEEEA